MTTSERLRLLGECSSLFEPFTGSFDRGTLHDWVVAELGHPEALDHPVPRGPLQSMALAPERLLHVVSDNTPHAAFQSLLRGLVIGAGNLVKLPTSGLPEFSAAVARLPPELSALVEVAPELPRDWREWAQAVIVFGSDETLAWFAANTPPVIRLIPHGRKFSIAIVQGDCSAAARLVAQDVGLFDQRGCLSIHDVYLSSGSGLPGRDFAALVADEMEVFNRHTPRAALGVIEAGTITSLRESVRFSAATRSAEVALWHSEGSTDWTVVFEADPQLKVSPLNRVVFVKPWPESGSRAALGPECAHLSTLAIHPFSPDPPATLLSLGATRLCPLGQTQEPSLFWHHDGLSPLASLCSWVDLG